MRDGRILDRVLMVDVRVLGRRPRVGDLGYALWPSKVVAVTRSPHAVDAALIERLLAQGEIAMGLGVVGLIFRDGRQVEWVLDPTSTPAFPPIPVGASVADIAAVQPLHRDQLGHWGTRAPAFVIWQCEHL